LRYLFLCWSKFSSQFIIKLIEGTTINKNLVEDFYVGGYQISYINPIYTLWRVMGLGDKLKHIK